MSQQCPEEHLSLAPFPITHVLYPQENAKWGMLMALGALAPFHILSAYLAAFVARRSLVLVTMTVGQLLCEALNAFLKGWWKQARPSPCLGNGYGMPSSHSQFAAFAATFIILYMHNRVSIKSLWVKVGIQLGVAASALFICYSRAALSYHTDAQVLVGASVGVFFALAWYVLTEGLLRPLGCFSWLLQTPLARWIDLRDDALTPGIWAKERDASTKLSTPPKRAKSQ